MIDDGPDGATLLELARETLMKTLVPQLPEAERLAALLVAGAMAIAGRELRADETRGDFLRAGLTRLYGEGRDDERLRRLAADIRAGVFDAGEGRRAVGDLLKEWTRAKLATSSPGWVKEG